MSYFEAGRINTGIYIFESVLENRQEGKEISTRASAEGLEAIRTYARARVCAA